MPRAASDVEPADGQRAPEPDALAAGVGADHVDLAERVGLARAGRPGAPWSSRTRRGRRRRTRGGSPRGRTTAPARGARSMSTVQAPCSGWPAKARLFTSTQAASSSPGQEGAHGRCRRASGAGRRAGAAPASASSSRSGVKPGALGRASASASVGAVDPEGDVATAVVRRPRRARAASSSSRSVGASRDATASSIDHSSAWWCARCAYARSPRRRRADRRGRGAGARRACPSTCRRRAGRCPSPPRRRRRGRGCVRRRRAAKSAQHLRNDSTRRRVASRPDRRTDRSRGHGDRQRTSRECRRGSISGAPIPQGAADFYGALFGWDAPRARRRPVATASRWSATARSPASGRRRTPGRRCGPRYIAVESADDAAEKVTARRRPGDRAADGRARRRAHGGVHRPGRARSSRSGRRARTRVRSS